MQSIRKKSFAAEQLAKRQKKNPITIAVIVVAMVIAIGAVGYALYVRFGEKEVPTETVAPEQEQIKSIAVLPFVDMSPNKDQEWFCDGISDAILNALTHIGNLRVPGRTSSFSFKGKDTNFAEIGRQLNVESVLEGSIVKSGNRLRITAQLIKADDGFHLWSETYNRETEDVFPLIEEISLKIVEALKIDLLSNEKAAIEKRYTENIEAYNLYLQGRYYWNQRTEEGLKKAIELFQQAVEQDPTFALAYAGLADSYNLLSLYGPFPANEVMPKAKASALKALEIDNTLAEAYTSLAFYRFSYEWDWEGADIEFKKAIELNPGYPTAHHWYAEYLSATGKLNESIAEMKRALELDPLSPIIARDLGEKFYYMRRFDEAIEQFKKTLEMYPNFSPAYLILSRAYAQKGMYEEAIDSFQKAREIPGYTGQPSGLGYIYAISGERDKAEQILHALIKQKKEEFISSGRIAIIYAGLGETDKAFEWLEKACEEHTYFVSHLKVGPQWDSLRSDPRFKALLKKMGLPED